MIDFYQHIEEGLKLHFEMAPELADVRKFSAEPLELVFAHDELAKRFPQESLPALQLTTQVLQTRSRPSAAAELVYEVPLDIDVIVSRQVRAEARARALELQHVVERMIHRLRRGADAEGVWGSNFFIDGDVESTLLLVEGPARIFAVANIEATVQHFVGIDE